MNSLFSFGRIRDKFYTLSAREQLLVVMVLGVALYFVFESLVFTPQKTRHTELMASHVMADSRVVVLRAEILAAGHSDGALKKEQDENARLKKQSTMLDAVMNSLQGSSPQVGELVRRVLKDYPHVTLDALKTLPVKSLVALPQGKKDATTATVVPMRTLYKHGVEIEIHGNFLDLLSYLKNLENSSHNVFWSDLRLRTVKYPEAALTLTIFILSDQPILKIS